MAVDRTCPERVYPKNGLVRTMNCPMVLSFSVPNPSISVYGGHYIPIVKDEYIQWQSSLWHFTSSSLCGRYGFSAAPILYLYLEKLQAQNRPASCFSIHNVKGPSLRPRKSAINNTPLFFSYCLAPP